MLGRLTRFRELLPRTLGVAAAAAAVVALTAAPAGAAGGGYGPPPPTPPVAPGGGTIVTVINAGPTGGQGCGTISGVTVCVAVPKGTFDKNVQVIIVDTAGTSLAPPAPDGKVLVVAFGIYVEVNGKKYTGTLSPPIQVTLSGQPVSSADQVIVQNTTGGAFSPVDETLSNGTITFTISADPNFEVLATSSVVPGSPTSVHTGKHFVLEGTLGGLLLVGGGLALARGRRRRSAA